MTVIPVDIPRQRAIPRAAPIQVQTGRPEPRAIRWLRTLLVCLAAAIIGGIAKELLYSTLGDWGSSVPAAAVIGWQTLAWWWGR